MPQHNITFLHSKKPVPYMQAQSFMKQRVEEILNDDKENLVWFLEHPSVYTQGRSAKEEGLVACVPRAPIFPSERGGKYTYHGPGQLIIYTLFHLKKTPFSGIHDFVFFFEDIFIELLEKYHLRAFRSPVGFGLWVETRQGQKKILAYGLRVTRWVTWHGFSLNLSTDLSYYKDIIPCGIKDFGVSSLYEETQKKVSCTEIAYEIEALIKKKYNCSAT